MRKGMKFGSVHFDEQSKKLKQPASDRPTKLDDSKKNRMNISNDFIGMPGYPGYIYIYIYISLIIIVYLSIWHQFGTTDLGACLKYAAWRFNPPQTYFYLFRG